MQVGKKGNEKDKKRKESTHKLMKKAFGPYVLTEISDSNTATITDGTRTENVHIARSEFTCPTRSDRDRLISSEIVKSVIRKHYVENESFDEVDKRKERTGSTREYVVDSIDSYKTQPKIGLENYLYLIKRFGFKERAWKPVKHLYKSQARRYHRNKNFPLALSFHLARDD